MNTGEHSTWNFWNGSATIRMGKEMGKDKFEGKKKNFGDSGHHSRNYFNDKQDNVQTGCKKSTKITTADSEGTCRIQGSASASSMQHQACWKMLEGWLRW